MMKKVTKAVIPAAGLGTRVLPATKAMPKGMLPAELDLFGLAEALLAAQEEGIVAGDC